jgi:hypothetical protein
MPVHHFLSASHFTRAFSRYRVQCCGDRERRRRTWRFSRPVPWAMKVADGFEPGAVSGPLIDMKAVEKIETQIADAVRKDAKIVIGGKRAAATFSSDPLDR